MLPWSWLAPALFGWREIRFLQAPGPLAVTQILFGGFRGRHGPRSHGRRTLGARWNEMTPKEREQFQAGMQCCSGRGKPGNR